MSPLSPTLVAVTGATGLVGSALVQRLRSEGFGVRRLVRPSSKIEPMADDVPWDPEHGRVDLERLAGVQAVVHLAGEGIADQPWSSERKRKIVESRVVGTRLITQAMLQLSPAPSVFVGASAVGVYGDRGDEELDEGSPLPPPEGSGFLAQTGAAWEGASSALVGTAIRRVLARIGIVLSKDGGALGKMLPPFRLGLGGVIGSGRQWMSWITLDDVVSALLFAIQTPSLSGPVNLVAPTPTRNRDFVHALGRVLHRPTIVPLPAFGVRVLFGEMGQEALLGGQRVHPHALTRAGFAFVCPTLEPAIRHALDG